MALTDAKVRNAKAKDVPQKLVESGGLYLWIAARTGAKSWRYDYRLLGKRKTLTIGRYPEISLANAKAAHQTARSLVEREMDPNEHRRAETQKKIAAGKNTFEAVARDFIAKRLTKGDPEKRWTEGYATKVTRMLERDVFPKVGAMRITEVTAAELSPIIESVAERKKVQLPHQKKLRVRKRGAAGTAVHIRQLCRSVFAHAAAKGLARYDFDPTWGLKGVVTRHAVQHAKHLALDELPDFWKALSTAATGERVKIGIELLALTFVRTAELRQAERHEFDLEAPNPHWLIPAKKMKKRRDHLVPLVPLAVELVKRLIELSDGTSPYLFPSRTDPDKAMNPNTINQTLYRMGYAGRLSGHGLRGTASTALHERGFAPHLIEMQLAHFGGKDKTATSYNHAQYFLERVEMMRIWSEMLHSDQANIVPFKKKASPID